MLNKLTRLNYDIRTAQAWALYAQRVVAGVLPHEAREDVDRVLAEARAAHPADDQAYCDAHEAHVRRVFGVKLRVV
jgi:hypothetical protein